MAEKKKSVPVKKDEITPGPGRTLRDGADTQPALSPSVRDCNGHPPPDPSGKCPEHPDEFNATNDVVENCESSLLNSILESMDSAVFSVDREYRYTSFNSHHADVMKRLYGADIRPGTSLFEYQSVTGDRILAKRNLDRALAGELVTVEAFSGEESRSRRYFEVAHRPVKGADNTIVGVVVSAQDITGLRRAEEAVRESEERYRRICEGLTDYLYTVQVLDGRAVSTVHGAACVAVTGFTAEEFARDPYLWITMVLDEDRERVISHIHAVLKGEPVLPVEHRIVRKDGQVRWVPDTPILHRDADGRLVSYDGVIKDITATKRAEEALQESERTYRNLYELAQVGLFETSLRDGTVIACNERYATLAGFSSVEDAIGKDIVHLYADPGDRKEVSRILHEKGRIDDHIVRFKNHQTGRPFWAQFSARINTKEDAAEGTIIDISEQKRAEQELSAKHEELMAAFEQLTATEEELKGQFDALAESEQTIRINENRLRMSQKIGRIGAWEYSFETNRIWGSAEGLRIFGYPAVAGDFPIGDIEACIPERERVHKALVDLITEGKDYNLEYAINPADGSAKKVIHSIARIDNDAEGKPLRVVGVIQDITERKRAEEEVQHLTRFQKSIIDNALVWLSVLDPVGKILVWNAAAAEISGYRSDEVIGSSVIWKQLYPEKEYRQQVTSTINRIIREHKYLENFETVIRTKDGNEKIVSWNTKALPDATGTTSDYIVIGMDVTDRHRAEEALRTSESKYRLLVENIHTAVVVLNPDTSILMINRTALDLLGLTLDEAIGRIASHSSWHFSREDGTVLPLADYPVNPVLATQKPLRNMLMGIFRPRNPDTVWVLVNADPEYDEKGIVTAVIVTFTDISDLKQAEEQLHKTVDELKRFNNLTVDRELRMIALKQEVNALLKKAGEAEKYRSRP